MTLYRQDLVFSSLRPSPVPGTEETQQIIVEEINEIKSEILISKQL